MLVCGHGKREKSSEASAALRVKLVCFITRQSAKYAYRTTHKIVGGRHPMVDIGLQEQGRLFTANDCTVGGKESILLITGYAVRMTSLTTKLTSSIGLIWQERVPISDRTP